MSINQDDVVADLQEDLPIIQKAIFDALKWWDTNLPLDKLPVIKDGPKAAVINNLIFAELSKSYVTGDKIGHIGEHQQKDFLLLRLKNKQYYIYFNKLKGNASATQNGTTQSLNLFSEQNCFDGDGFDVIRLQCGYDLGRSGDVRVKLILAPGQIDSWCLDVTKHLEQTVSQETQPEKESSNKDEEPRRSKSKFKPIGEDENFGKSGTEES